MRYPFRNSLLAGLGTRCALGNLPINADISLDVYLRLSEDISLPVEPPKFDFFENFVSDTFPPLHCNATSMKQQIRQTICATAGF